MPSIAIIGASRDRQKFGNRCVRAFLRLGYTVYPIHPSETEIEGFPCYPSIADLPISEVDLVSLYLPPRLALTILPDLTTIRFRELWLNPGVDSPDVIERANALKLPVRTGCSIVSYGETPIE